MPCVLTSRNPSVRTNASNKQRLRSAGNNDRRSNKTLFQRALRRRKCRGIVRNYIFRIPFRENTLAFLLMSNRRLNSVHRKSASTRGHLRQYHVSIFVMKNLDPRFDYIFCHEYLLYKLSLCTVNSTPSPAVHSFTKLAENAQSPHRG